MFALVKRFGRRPWSEKDHALHDCTTTTFLSREHVAGLAAGKVRVPRPVQYAHRAVMVTVAGGRHGIVWVDAGIAEVVLRAAQLGYRMVDSCEGGPAGQAEHDDDRASVYFATGRQAAQFAAEVAPAAGDGSHGLIVREGAGVFFAPELTYAVGGVLVSAVLAERANR